MIVNKAVSNIIILLFLGILKCIVNILLKKEVKDIIIVPISINYDRLLEDKLYCYELLGIPKPKETTLVSQIVIYLLITNNVMF